MTPINFPTTMLSSMVELWLLMHNFEQRQQRAAER